MGGKKGTSDPRSNIMEHCISVIRTKLPKYFILENVKNFKTIEKGAVFRYLLEQLEGIGGSAYNVSWDILNTRDYGIPQNRERIFFIGTLKSLGKVYTTPVKKEMKLLDSFIEDKTVHDVKITKNGKMIIDKYSVNQKDNNVIACSGFGNYMKGMSPTIACNTRYYLTKYQRKFTPRECLNLQGFKQFNQVVSDTQIYRQAGNSMSVNVLECILSVILNDQ
jgi:DNA (cytosine-5)-methyltransferase 1